MGSRRLRLYHPQPGKSFQLSREDAKHIRARRLRKGDRFELFDGQGTVYEAELLSLSPARARLLGLKRVDSPSIRLALFFPLLKPSKVSSILEQTVPLGIMVYQPVKYARSQPACFFLNRCQKAAIEALKQCGRSFLPEIEEPVAFDRALEKALKYRLRVAAVPEKGVGELQKIEEAACLFIGPEGGFDHKELQAFSDHGFAFISWQNTVFRAELAAVVFSVLLLALTDDQRLP